ncbi:glycosyltransferase family 2 protein [Kineococcus arenarius]|uniref:glycosyltransferase family 2 protein n=1 Tax=Kineococcus sp. SYSU DK007 TaxID=3383128 RepID=UPI003D7DD088
MGFVPKVCIGIPVYNGAKYVAATIESALSQDFEDLEVVISDNASTDGTAEICQGFARRDPRVRYVHHEEHVGVADSFSRTFSLCRSEFFKWAASDDISHPTFVGKALKVLEEHPAAVVCYSEAAVLNAQGERVRNDDFMIDLSGSSASQRFRRVVMAPIKHHAGHEQYGLIRSEALRRAGAMSNHAYGDRVLLVRLALQGPMLRIPEVLFFNRDHDGRSQRNGARRTRPGSKLSRWIGVGPWPPSEFWNPAREGRIVFPEWDLAIQYLLAAAEADIPVEEKARCVAAVVAVAGVRAPKYGRDLLVGAEQGARLLARGRLPWKGGLETLG